MSEPAFLFLFATSAFAPSCLLAVPVPYMAPGAKDFEIEIRSPLQDSHSCITSRILFASLTGRGRSSFTGRYKRCLMNMLVVLDRDTPQTKKGLAPSTNFPTQEPSIYQESPWLWFTLPGTRISPAYGPIS